MKNPKKPIYKVTSAEEAAYPEGQVAEEEPIEEEPTPMWQIWLVGTFIVTLVLSLLGVSFRETVAREFL